MIHNGKKIAQAALASVVTLGLLSTAQQAAAAEDAAKNKDVKCYGVAASEKNDCGTVVSACAGSIAKAGACYAWIFLPEGTCKKIVNSSVGKPDADCKGPDGKPALK
jgi:uncharacterized membrane protein